MQRERSDRYRAAVHEHAHAAVAAHFGGIGSADVWPIPTSDPLHEKGWVGCFTLYAAPGSIDIPDEARKASGIVAAPPNWRALVALAGSLAEHAIDTDDPLSLLESIADYLTDADLSDTDRAMASGWTEYDLKESCRLVVRLLPQIASRAASEAGGAP